MPDALQFNPEDIDTLTTLARLCEKQGDWPMPSLIASKFDITTPKPGCPALVCQGTEN